MAGNTPTVYGISGSLRDGSHTRTGVRTALEAAAERGAQTELIDLRVYDLPRFDPNADEPADASKLTAKIDEADAVILGTPMYHGSYASPIKNALDYSSRDDWKNTTVGLIVISGGAFPLPALEHLRGVCRALEAWVRPIQAAIPTADDIVDGDVITDDATRERVRKVGQDITEYAHVTPTGPTASTGSDPESASSDD